MEREKSQKKPSHGRLGYQLETTALISIDNYNAFRITCIMLILEKLNITVFIPNITFDFMYKLHTIFSGFYAFRRFHNVSQSK